MCLDTKTFLKLALSHAAINILIIEKGKQQYRRSHNSSAQPSDRRYHVIAGCKITKFANPALGKLDNRLLSRIQESIWDKNAQKIF